MKIHRTHLLSCFAFVLACSVSDTHASIIWSEAGDAGDSLLTANETTGTGTLEAITGTLPNGDVNNVDIFKLSIADLSLFSATTDNFPDTDLLDSWLYLFDDSGRGVAASATTVGGSFNATIGLGSVSGPSGIYYLAITRFDTVPLSPTGDPFSPTGEIFPDPFLNSTNGEVLGPTGPGGSYPLSGWSAPDPLLDFENYRIDLTGAEPASASAAVVPEPSSLLIWALAVIFAISAALRARLLGRRKSDGGGFTLSGSPVSLAPPGF